ncbi:hypothetical protein [Lewinella cohaerens]|uniref:hypothetical protein n=1 Tax=Lewinella cohaerens TaxID=70995 RepID=UPI00037EB096|nr:hypothetical protein [Lewinella cohaerens]
MKITEFIRREDFEEYLGINHHENEDELHKLIEVKSIDEWKSYDQFMLNFGEYDQLFLLIEPITRRLFLGDVNLGGHFPRARIVEISRSDLFDKPSYVKSWYMDFSKRFWQT